MLKVGRPVSSKIGFEKVVVVEGGTATRCCLLSPRKICHRGEWSRAKYGAKASGGAIGSSSVACWGFVPSAFLAIEFFGGLRPRSASTSLSSGSMSSRSSSFTSGIFTIPGGITRALTTNCTRLLGIMCFSPMTLKKTFSTLTRGIWRATETASLYC